MKVHGWYVMGWSVLYIFLSGCGGAKMDKEITDFKWYAVATAHGVIQWK